MNTGKKSIWWIIGITIGLFILSDLAIVFFMDGLDAGNKITLMLVIALCFLFHGLLANWIYHTSRNGFRQVNEDLKKSILTFPGSKKTEDARQQDESSTLQSQLESLLSAFQSKTRPPYYRQRFLVKHGKRLLPIETGEIAWFHAEGKMCFLKTWDNHRFLIDYTLEEIKEMLDPDQFFRVNRSYIVHLKAIKNINDYFKGKLIIQLQPAANENDVVISKEKTAEFKIWLGK